MQVGMYIWIYGFIWVKNYAKGKKSYILLK